MGERKERPRLVPARPGVDDRLDSWKEIAAYLGREPRTVRRWEKEEGLPVHRLQHGRAGSVYAHKSELDAWVARRSAPSGPRPAKGRFRIILSAAAVLAVVTAAGWLLWRRPARPNLAVPVPLTSR